MSNSTLQIAKKALETEILAVAIYQHLAKVSKDKDTQKAYLGLSEMELGHVKYWALFLKKRGVDASRIKPGALKIWYHKLMLKSLGRSLTLKIMENNEDQAVEMYSALQESPDLDEKEKAELRNVLADELVHESYFIAEENKLESFTLYIKDAVLGLSDGLVEILSVTTGLAGASGSTMAVAISGLVVGVAGGLAMGISTYTSSRSQRQVHEGTLRRIASSARFVGHLFKERVLNYLVKRGYTPKVSSDMAEETARDQRLLTTVIAEQEYGLKEERFGSPLKSGLFAGISNLVASFVPLLPYFFTDSILLALVLSLVLATVSLAITGFLVAILANMTPGQKIGEMLLTGLGTAAVTYGIGRLAAHFLGVKE